MNSRLSTANRRMDLPGLGGWAWVTLLVASACAPAIPSQPVAGQVSQAASEKPEATAKQLVATGHHVSREPTAAALPCRQDANETQPFSAAIEQVLNALASEIDDPQIVREMRLHAAWILSTHDDPRRRDGHAALRLVQSIPPSAEAELEAARCDALAAAQAELGQFVEARQSIRRALEAATGANSKALAEQRREREQLYRQEMAFREPAEAPLATGDGKNASDQRLACLLVATARHLSRSGSSEPALKLLRWALALDEQCVAARLEMADAQWQAGELAQAGDQYAAALAVDPRQTLALANLATIRKLQGQAGEAAKLYRQALQIEPNSWEIANSLAWLRATAPGERDRNAAEAVELAERVCREAPEHADYLDTLSAAYAAAGRFDDALAAIDRAISLTPLKDSRREAMAQRRTLYQAKQPFDESAQTYLRLAEMHWEAGELDEAAADYFSALARDGENALALANLATILKDQQRPREAVYFYRLSVQQEPTALDVANSLAWQLATLDGATGDERQEAVLQAVRINQASEHRHFNYLDTMAVAFAASGRFDHALSAIDRAERLLAEAEPTDVERWRPAFALRRALFTAKRPYRDDRQAHGELGDVHMQAQHWTEAAAAYRAALAIDPRDSRALANLATIHKVQGDRQRAVELYTAALTLEPNAPDVANSLAWLLATHPDEAQRDGSRAVALAERLCTATNYQEPLYLDTLAAAYAADQRFDQALATAKKTLLLVTLAKRPQLLADLESRLKLYQSRQPFIESAAEGAAN